MTGRPFFSHCKIPRAIYLQVSTMDKLMVVKRYNNADSQQYHDLGNTFGVVKYMYMFTVSYC